MSDWSVRLPRLPPLATDAVLTAALLVLTTAPAIRVLAGDPVLAAFHVAVQAPLVWRRRAPFPVFGLLVAIAFAEFLTTSKITPGNVALLVALYTVAVRYELRNTLAAGAAVIFVAVLDAFRFIPHESPAVVLETTVGVGSLVIAAGMIGAYVRSRRAYLEALVERAAQLERERDQNEQVAVARERTRIAREMHDVVTHSLSVMVTLADGAAAAAGPGKAADAIRLLAETGRQALTDMRRFLNVLRADEPEEMRHPQPDVARLDGLAAQVRAAGLPVRLRVDGDTAALSASVQLTLYRLVQESLTNTLKHAAPGATALVRVSRLDDVVDVEVCDNGRPLSPPGGAHGHGIDGMRDRVAAYGGRLEAGPLPHGGWRVAARLNVGGIGDC